MRKRKKVSAHTKKGVPPSGQGGSTWIEPQKGKKRPQKKKKSGGEKEKKKEKKGGQRRELTHGKTMDRKKGVSQPTGCNRRLKKRGKGRVRKERWGGGGGDSQTTNN